uniref:Uncharacterized protein n=1 Tax=Myoviridae sp. ctBoB21 TaxID=2827287 RepID=A0A8S5R6T5_9CAUD|nr:MAG TPA: hypothetical protein [Myoviridae sp. ctBoB21]
MEISSSRLAQMPVSCRLEEKGIEDSPEEFSYYMREVA